MGDHLRGLVGLILGVVVGLWLVVLLDDVLIRHAIRPNGALEIALVILVAVVGCAAGAAMGSGNRRD
jgi:NhaP-type Na+/H+ or K+/H+ antiporter